MGKMLSEEPDSLLETWCLVPKCLHHQGSYASFKKDWCLAWDLLPHQGFNTSQRPVVAQGTSCFVRSL